MTSVNFFEYFSRFLFKLNSVYSGVVLTIIFAYSFKFTEDL